MDTNFHARQVPRQRLQAIETLLQTYQPGAFADQKAEFQAAAKSLGIPIGDTQTMSADKFQEFTKYATANVFDNIKGMGGRVLVSEILGLTKANANPEMQPAAAAAIVAQGLGTIDYEDQYYKDYFNWKKQNPNAVQTADFNVQWTDQNPLEKFVGAESKRLGYSGQNIPAAAQRTVGQTYVLPNGPAQWQADGWHKFQ